jgi:hypothetical protein
MIGQKKGWTAREHSTMEKKGQMKLAMGKPMNL